MRTRIAIIAAAALAMTGVLLTCTANGGSIYATIEKEVKIPVSTLNQTITVQDIVKVAAATNPYFVAAGAIYNGSVPDSNNNVGWPTVGQSPVPIRAPLDASLNPAISQAMAASPFLDNAVYASFFSSDGSAIGLYKSFVGNPYSFRPSDGATQISGPSSGDATLMGKQVVFLAATPTNGPIPAFLFAVAATLSVSGTSYELDYSLDGATWAPVKSGASGTLSGLTPSITGVALFNSVYYVTSGGTLYTGSDPRAAPGFTATTLPNEKGSELLRGVTADGTNILIPGKQGTVYVSSNGTTWTLFTTADLLNGTVVGFLTVSQAVSANGPVYLVGTDGNGFYYLNVGASNGTIGAGLSRFSDVTVTGLYAGAVHRILVDGPLVFMGALATGLWRSSFDVLTGQAGTWIHE
jgi:hypothetical protein